MSSVRLIGTFRINVLLEDRVVEIRETTNLIPDVGLKKLLNYLLCITTPALSHIAVGSGTAAPTSGDTALISEIGRKAFLDKKLTDTSILLSVWFGSADANGTWNEIGIFDAATGGTLFARSLVSPAIEKTPEKVVYVEYEIAASGG